MTLVRGLGWLVLTGLVALGPGCRSNKGGGGGDGDGGKTVKAGKVVTDEGTTKKGVVVKTDDTKVRVGKSVDEDGNVKKGIKVTKD